MKGGGGREMIHLFILKVKHFVTKKKSIQHFLFFLYKLPKLEKITSKSYNLGGVTN